EGWRADGPAGVPTGRQAPRRGVGRRPRWPRAILLRHGPIAGPREALGERTRVVVEHGAEESPARADPVDLAGGVPSHARALSDRVGGQSVPERQRHLLERRFAWGLRSGVGQLLQTDAELLPPRAR